VPFGIIYSFEFGHYQVLKIKIIAQSFGIHDPSPCCGKSLKECQSGLCKQEVLSGALCMKISVAVSPKSLGVSFNALFQWWTNPVPEAL